MKRAVLPIAGVLAALALFLGSKELISWHLSALADVRDQVLPLAAELLPLEDRLKILQQQVELSELQATLRSGTAEEKLRAYVLPEGADLSRLVAFFDILGSTLGERGVLKELSSMTAEEPRPYRLAVRSENGKNDALQAQRLKFTAQVDTRGYEQLVALLDASGLITVGDALGESDLQKLFAITESQNYAGIVPVEQFLSADLLEYLRDPTVTDERLTQAFPSEEFIEQFHSLLDSSRLASVRAVLGGSLGETLAEKKMWPMPFLVPENLTVRERGDGWLDIEVTLDAIMRVAE